MPGYTKQKPVVSHSTFPWGKGNWGITILANQKIKTIKLRQISKKNAFVKQRDRVKVYIKHYCRRRKFKERTRDISRRFHYMLKQSNILIRYFQKHWWSKNPAIWLGESILVYSLCKMEFMGFANENRELQCLSL